MVIPAQFVDLVTADEVNSVIQRRRTLSVPSHRRRPRTGEAFGRAVALIAPPRPAPMIMAYDSDWGVGLFGSCRPQTGNNQGGGKRAHRPKPDRELPAMLLGNRRSACRSPRAHVTHSLHKNPLPRVVPRRAKSTGRVPTSRTRLKNAKANQKQDEHRGPEAVNHGHKPSPAGEDKRSPQITGTRRRQKPVGRPADKMRPRCRQTAALRLKAGTDAGAALPFFLRCHPQSVKP